MSGLDTDIRISVPEYIVFRYDMAGPISRFFAALIDFLAVVAFFIGFVIFLTFAFVGVALFSQDMSRLLFLTLLMVAFIINWGYFVLFEWLNRGRTFGKMAMSLRVVSHDGTSLDLSQIALRNLLRIADMFPYIPFFFTQIPTYLVGMIASVASGRSFQRLGDLAAGTIVIRERKRPAESVEVVDDAHVREISGRLNLRVVPAQDLIQALNEFVLRRNRLSPGRLREIAEAVEEDLRNFFGAQTLKCDPEDLIFAVHHYLFSKRRAELKDLSSDLRQSIRESIA